MELFWDFAFTVALSFLLPLIFIKLLSMTPNIEPNEKVAVIGSDHDHEVKNDSQNWETDGFVRIVGNFDEFRDTPTLGKPIVPEKVDVSNGSPKIRNSGKIETELVDLVKDHVEGDCGLTCGCAVDESINQGVKINQEELIERESRAHKIEEVEISQCERDYNEIDEFRRNEEEVGENRGFLDEDDWEGIERTELERRFGAAVVFVESKSNVDLIANLSNDVKTKLYGYHKIATQGPCQEPQPMALKFSARAKC
ncbi:FERM/acyl-CoA-binding protein superfamily [Sesbania bispinosa]|nr:FERM/acyl-CoA-binding protein superfamily [Sesbania bispinosa]